MHNVRLGLSHPAAKNGLLNLARFIADCGSLVILWPVLISANLFDLAIVCFTCVYCTVVILKAHTNLRTANNLNGLVRLIKRHGSVTEFTPADYLRQLGQTTPVVVDKHGQQKYPIYRILRIPGHNGYSSYQYHPYKSFVLVPFEPHEANHRKLFYLLHELGHIGHRNFQNATAKVYQENEFVLDLAPGR